MRYVIYMDVFFAVNFFVDIIILVIVRRFVKPQTTIRRCVTAAVTGTTLSCIITVWKLPAVIVQKIFTYVIIPSVMVFAGWPIKSAGAYIRVMTAVYGVTLVMAGAVNGIYYFTSAGYYLNRGISLTSFIFITAVAYFITCFFVKTVKTRSSHGARGNDIYNVSLWLGEKRVILKGLYDTGNSLREPIEGTPVHIAEYGGIKELLEGVEAEKTKIRIVPYRSVGMSMGVLRAVELDRAEIEIDGEYIEINKVMIGIYEGSLSGTGAYQMILNRSIKKWL